MSGSSTRARKVVEGITLPPPTCITPDAGRNTWESVCDRDYLCPVSKAWRQMVESQLVIARAPKIVHMVDAH